MLPKQHIILELEILLSFEFDPEFADLILRDSELVLDATDLSLVVLEIVLGGLGFVYALF